MANVVFNFAGSDKSEPASLRETLERRNIPYEEKKEGNMTVISIKANTPKTSGKPEDDKTESLSLK